MSTIGWIDFSRDHRDKVFAVLDLLNEPGVVDELGIGIVRDSFADNMFPGISTIQTRAKYFTLTACLINRYKNNHGRKSLESYLEEEEKLCRIKLVERYGEKRTNLGIIGSSFGLDQHRDVVRKPSSIYWNGLRTFGMISPVISLSEFSARLSNPKPKLKVLLEETGRDRGDDLDAEESMAPRIITPKMSDNYLNELYITLTYEEAVFLRQQIIATKPESLIGQILMDESAIEQFMKMQKGSSFETFAELPFISKLENLDLVLTVEHARDFWFILYGAHIRYNCLLQERYGFREKREEFEELWDKWQVSISDFPTRWDTSFMWEQVKNHQSQVPDYTRKFIEDWISEVRLGASNLDRCNDLVTQQEHYNKRGRARLKPNSSDVHVNEWIGLSSLEYRLPQVWQIVKDIYDGEHGRADA
ncbi:DUF6361 family protein [Candidatus Latescibacterota bacterium]